MLPSACALRALSSCCFRLAQRGLSSSCHVSPPSVSQSHQSRLQLMRLGFSHAQAASLILGGRAPTMAEKEPVVTMDGIADSISVLRRLGVREPHRVLTKLGAPLCFQLDAEAVNSRVQFLCQFLTRAACSRLVESRPRLLTRDLAELNAIADYLVMQCGYATDVLSLMPSVWQLDHHEVVTRREIFAKTGRLSRQPKQQFNQRSVAGCDCFSLPLPAFLQQVGISEAEYQLYSDLTQERLLKASKAMYITRDKLDKEEAGEDDSDGESDADGDDDGDYKDDFSRKL